MIPENKSAESVIYAAFIPDISGNGGTLGTAGKDGIAGKAGIEGIAGIEGTEGTAVEACA